MLRPAVILIAAALVCPLSGSTREASLVAWRGSVEIAAGGGERGPWQQNESRYDYVDDPTVALDRSGNAAVAWVDQGRKDVFFTIFGAEGKPRLADPVNVSRTPAVFSWLPRVVLSPLRPGDVFILWQEIVFSGGSHGGEIFFARSRDGGRTFDAPLNLSRSRAGDGKGRINRDVWHNGSLDLAIDAHGTLYAAWTEYEGPLWFCRSRDGGASFTKAIRVAGGGKPARAPALAVAPDGSLYLAWTHGEDDSADVNVARSSDGGRSFARPAVVARTPGYSDAPKIAVDAKGVVHLVHAESEGGPFERYHVRYTRSHDQARTFEAPRDLSQLNPSGVTSAAFPAIEADHHGRIVVVWETYPNARTNPRGLAIAVSLDHGERFSAPASVPRSAGAAGGSNGSHQGLLMRKLALTDGGEIALVNSSLAPGAGSRVWLMRGRVSDTHPAPARAASRATR